MNIGTPLKTFIDRLLGKDGYCETCGERIQDGEKILAITEAILRTGVFSGLYSGYTEVHHRKCVKVELSEAEK